METRELLQRIRRIEIATKRAVQDRLQGQYHSVFKGRGMAFSEVRAYAPGDPPNRIDWAVYARSDRYLLRRTEDETRLRAHLLVDVSESMAYGAKLPTACGLAAALAYVLVRQGDAVELHQHAFLWVQSSGTAQGARRDERARPGARRRAR